MITKYTTISIKNKWQIEYRNICQGPTEIVDAYAAGLWSELAIITNGSNLTDLNKVEKTAKNVKSASLINKNMIAAVINFAVAEVKELRVQILELKAEVKKAKYVSWEDRKLSQNNGENRKPLTL